MKTVAVQVGEEIREVALQPGSTVADLKRSLGIPDS
jgi:hypothetical protein